MLVVGFVGAALVVGVHHLPRRVATAVAAAALVAGLAGPAAYSVATAATPHPARSRAPVRRRPAVFGRRGPAARRRAPRSPARPGGFAAGAAGGTTGGATGGAAPAGCSTAAPPSTALNTLLETDASSYTWVAAAVGSNSAAGYQLATQQPVMAIGGFNGSDPSPTLAQFQQWVAEGQIHYFIAQGSGGFGGGGGPNAGGSTLVADRYLGRGHLHRQTVDGVTVYDLTTG